MLPRKAKTTLRLLLTQSLSLYPRLRLQLTAPADGPLDRTALHNLQQRFDTPDWDPCDPGATLERGRQRVAMLRRRFQNRFDSWKACLEVGCYDGLVSFWLASSGKRCLGIDMSTEGFDPRAREQGVRFSRMDAQQLACENNRFDFVCSFNAFEHIPDPARALREAVRVLRPGGIVYVACAPLYAAPFGLHAPEIGIPYAQFLFSPEALNAYCAEQGLRRIDFGGVNGWSPAQYRQSVDSLDGVVVEQYLQIYDPRYLGIISRYPGQFKRSGRAIDDFLIGGLEIVLRKG